MASSKRELIIQKFVSVLTDTAGIGGRVLRTQVDPNEREDCPFITVAWTTEQADPQTVALQERTMTVQVNIYTMGDEPDTLADPIAISAHSLIMADSSLGGLAIDCFLRDAVFDAVGADQPAGKLTHEYQVMYRQSYGDMTQ